MLKFASLTYAAGTAAGTTQATCLQLTANTNKITTAASAGVCLPCQVAAACVRIKTGATNATQVYGCLAVAAETDTVDGNAETVGVSQAANTDATYCTPAVSGTTSAWVTF